MFLIGTCCKTSVSNEQDKTVKYVKQVINVIDTLKVDNDTQQCEDTVPVVLLDTLSY